MRQVDTNEARIDLGTKATYFLAGIFLAALIRRIVRFLFYDQRTNEDRPPIIVREGSITFEHKVIHGKQLDWDDGHSHWTPKQPHGKKVDHFVAHINKGGSSSCPQTIESAALEIDYVQGTKCETFVLFIAGKKPMIRPKGLLRRDSGNSKRLVHGTPGSGNITRIRPSQGGLECDLSGDVEIEIDFAYEDDD